jgi:tRNA(fMet)-specific endonuclease VapC
MYLLDTDYIGIIQRRSRPAYDVIRSRLSQLPRSQFYLCVVSFHEQALGAHTYLAKARNLQSIVKGYRLFDLVLEAFRDEQVLPFDDAAAEVFQSLRQQKPRIGTMDLRIAAIAVAKQLTVLTRNVADFETIPGVMVEDWTTQ